MSRYLNKQSYRLNSYFSHEHLNFHEEFSLNCFKYSLNLKKDKLISIYHRVKDQRRSDKWDAIIERIIDEIDFSE